MTDLALTRALTRLLHARPADEDDLRSAERHLRDWSGSLVAGLATEEGAILLKHGAGRDDLEGRAFLAGALSHTTETDDLHRASVTHPACVVMPVALVLGRRVGIRGPALLLAALRGYEAMLRVGEALGPAHYRIFHNTATAGVFGAAAAAASLLGLDEDGWVWALGNAGTQAGGLWAFSEEGAMSKPLHAGQAVAAGLRAALLARHGFTGAERILEGEKGFFAGYCPDPDPEAILRPSDGWKLAETSLKPYPSCRHTHPAVDGALELRAKLGPEELQPDDVEEIRIATYDAARRLTDRSVPTTPQAARFSLQYCVSSALLHGAPDLRAFQSERVLAPPVRALLGRCRVEPSPELEAAYPARWGAELELHLTDGRRLRVRHPSAKGDPEAPLSEGELDSKVRALCAHGGLDPEETERLLERSKGLPGNGSTFPLPLPGVQQVKA